MPVKWLSARCALAVATTVVISPAASAVPRVYTEFDRLSQEAERLRDASAVKKLQRAYGYYLDKGYWRDAADLFADDATFEYGVDGIYVGKARILEYLVRQGGGNIGPGLPYGQYNRHMQLQPVVHVAADGRTARARWRELGMTGQYKAHAEWSDGIYENDYINQGGVWKIAALHFYPNFVAPYEGGWARLGEVPADWRSDVAKAFPSDRPPTRSYLPFPAQFTPPFHYGAAPDRAGSAESIDSGPRPDDLAQALSDYSREIAMLRSQLAIENLQAAYGYYVDKGRWCEAAALFARNGSWEFGQRGVYVGPAHIRRGLGLFGPEGLEKGQLNNTMQLQPIVTVASDNRTAKARWRSDVELARNGRGWWGEGTYENDYVNEGGVWKIARLHYYVTFQSDYDKGFIDGAEPMEKPSSAVPPDRPPTEVYEAIPKGYFPQYDYPNFGTLPSPPPTAGARLVEAPDATEPMAAEVQALGRLVTRLADEAAIEKVQRAYGYYVDKTQYRQVANLFARNGTLEIGGRGVFTGRDRVLEYLNVGLGGDGFKQGNIVNHQQFQGIVDVAPDGKTAKGRWTAFVMGGSTRAPVQWGDVTYENDYVKQDGVWRIAKLHAPFNMYALYKDGWAKQATPNTRPDSFAPPPDLPPTTVYLTYPSFYNEPFHYTNPVTGKPSSPPNPAAGGTAPMQATYPIRLEER